MGKKGYVTIYVDKEIAKEARELGLNISKICENALKEAIRKLKGENCERMGPGPGFEPGIPGSTGRCVSQTTPPGPHNFKSHL